MRRYLIPLLLILPMFASAQPNRGNDWVPYSGHSGCVGGSKCPSRSLRVPLEDRPVIAVRFKAHDQIGETAGGELRIKIDGNTIQDATDIPRAGGAFNIDVDELWGRYLVFEPATNDEVEISEIAVLYGRGTGRRPPILSYPGPIRGGGGWRQYPGAAGCIGGTECRKNGSRITVALENAPVLAVRFYAHDSIGERADGKLSVRIDDTTIGFYIDVQRNGKRHELEVDNLTGTRLVIETESGDEVDVKDVEVLYGRRSRGGPGGGSDRREITHEGGCIGGAECGGRKARIRIPIFGRPVESIRFYARDDIGARAGGELRIRIDDVILRDYLDITREGRTFTIDGKGLEGDYLIIEPAENDEVEVKDVRIRFGD